MKGFYNLASGVLTHQRNLNVIANNMTNASTAGYKQERYIATTFDEVMYSRVGNKDSEGSNIGEQSYIRATSEVTTDFSQGMMERTGMSLDFAINGEGFFAVRTATGEVGYTRMGTCSLDEEGYLCLPALGRVLDPNGNEIHLQTDKIEANDQGVLTYEGGALGQLGVFTFEDNTQLERNDMGLFMGDNAQAGNAPILHRYVERANTDIMTQMTDMIDFQRSLQGAAQVMKIYDDLLTKATGEIGRL